MFAAVIAAETGHTPHVAPVEAVPDAPDVEGGSEEPGAELAEGELKILLDAWGRYGGAIPVDDEAARDRRLIRMFRQYARGNYAAALSTAERILAGKRSMRDAFECARSCRARVELSQVEALGGPHASLRVMAAGPLLRALEQDERTSLMMSLIKRKLPLQEILDFHGELRFEALQAIVQLVEQGLLVKG